MEQIHTMLCSFTFLFLILECSSQWIFLKWTTLKIFKNFQGRRKYSRTTRCFSRIKDIPRCDSKFKDSSWRSRRSGNLTHCTLLVVISIFFILLNKEWDKKGWEPLSQTMGVGRWGLSPLEFEIFSIKVLCLVWVGKIKFHHFWPPLEKFRKNRQVSPHGKYSSDAHGFPIQTDKNEQQRKNIPEYGINHKRNHRRFRKSIIQRKMTYTDAWWRNHAVNTWTLGSRDRRNQ